MANETTLTLTGLSSGLAVDLSARHGLVSVASRTSALTGYRIETRTDADAEDGAGLAAQPYPLISFATVMPAEDPPMLEVSASYVQTVAFDEVDLDVRFKSLPKGSAIAVTSSLRALALARRDVSGSSGIAAVGLNLGAFTTDIALRLWVADPDGLTSTSRIDLTFSKIETPEAGPARRTILQRFAVSLGA